MYIYILYIGNIRLPMYNMYITYYDDMYALHPIEARGIDVNCNYNIRIFLFSHSILLHC